MNLFRSKEDARNWPEFDAGNEDGILTLQQGALVMSTPRHRDRLGDRYVSSVSEYAAMFFEHLRKVTDNSPFWAPPAT